ncbi:MAG: MutS-related protein [Pseudothermotoga sp.]
MIDAVLHSFQPVTGYGREFFKELRPVITDEKEFHRHWQRMQKVLKLDKLTIRAIRDTLTLLGSIKQQVENGFESIGDFAKLKRFVHYARRLSEFTKDIWELPDLGGLWKKLAEMTSESANFYLQSEVLLNLRKEHLLISEKIEKKFRSVIEHIETKFSIKLPAEEFTCDRETGERLIGENLVEVIRTSIERYHLRIKPTQEILELSEKLRRIEDQMKDQEQSVLKELRRIADSFLDILRDCEKIVQQIDLDLCRYDFFFRMNCCQPEISDRLLVRSGRFSPVVKYCKENDYTYYPVSLDATKGVTVLYGPNMGGKTTLLRTIGSFVVLMHLGFAVPCDSFCSPVFDSVRYLYRGEELGLSSFAKEISSFVDIFKTGGRKLILIDEFGSTTNPVEGEALALAVIDYLEDSEDFVFFTTHYPMVVKSAPNVYMCGKLKNLDAVDPHRMIDYSLETGKHIDQNVAIVMAQRFGMPEKIVQTAQNFLKKGDSCGKGVHGQ